MIGLFCYKFSFCIGFLLLLISIFLRAIEETYYKRTVDFYTNNKDAFVYFVDFDAGEQHERRVATTHSRYDSNFLVTATHALFIGNLKHSTPGNFHPFY